jgi:hypothetical protein
VDADELAAEGGTAEAAGDRANRRRGEREMTRFEKVVWILGVATLAAAFGCTFIDEVLKPVPQQPQQPPQEPQTPPPTNPPIQPPPEPAIASCGFTEADLVEAVPQRPQTPAIYESLRAAMGDLGPRPGSDPHLSRALLAAQMRMRGWCAIAGSEAVFVRALDGFVEEYHAVHEGTGDWTNGLYKGIHQIRGSETSVPGQPQPPVVAPPTQAVPPPIPLRVYEDGNAHWFLKCKPHVPRGVIDCTPKVLGQPEFCLQVFGKADLNCDLGKEGDPAREVREKYLYGDTFTRGTSKVCERWGENPMQFAASGDGNCRLCSTSEPRVCSDGF